MWVYKFAAYTFVKCLLTWIVKYVCVSTVLSTIAAIPMPESYCIQALNTSLTPVIFILCWFNVMFYWTTSQGNKTSFKYFLLIGPVPRGEASSFRRENFTSTLGCPSITWSRTRGPSNSCYWTCRKGFVFYFSLNVRQSWSSLRIVNCKNFLSDNYFWSVCLKSRLHTFCTSRNMLLNRADAYNLQPP